MKRGIFVFYMNALKKKNTGNFLFFPIKGTSGAAAPEGKFHEATGCWAF
jgi:hypothetical protein